MDIPKKWMEIFAPIVFNCIVLFKPKKKIQIYNQPVFIEKDKHEKRSTIYMIKFCFATTLLPGIQKLCGRDCVKLTPANP